MPYAYTFTSNMHLLNPSTVDILDQMSSSDLSGVGAWREAPLGI
jgi:hypothetical protein